MALANGIATNNSLSTLSLQNNEIGVGGAVGFARVLGDVTSGLHELFLENNPIGEDGAQQLGEALRANETLELLALTNGGSVMVQELRHCDGQLSGTVMT